MAANYGVNFTITNEAASPIKVQSDTPIGIAAAIKGANKEMIYQKAGFKSEEAIAYFCFFKCKQGKRVCK